MNGFETMQKYLPAEILYAKAVFLCVSCNRCAMVVMHRTNAKNKKQCPLALKEVNYE